MEMTDKVDYSVVQPSRGNGEHVVFGVRSTRTFPSALLPKEDGGATQPLMTLREMYMLQFMDAITDKPDWHIKIFDDAIAEKWKIEAMDAAHEEFLRAREAEDDESDEDDDDDEEDEEEDDEDEYEEEVDEDEEKDDEVEVEEEVEDGENKNDEQKPEANQGDNNEDRDKEDDEHDENWEDVDDDDDDDADAEEKEDEEEEDEEAKTDAFAAGYAVRLAPRDESKMTRAMADYCIEELRYKATRFNDSPNGAIIVYQADVVKSDTAVSPELQAALQAAVKPLEDVPGHLKDWHPGSQNQVLDLVHPSLFPLIYGTTPIIPVSEKAITIDDCLQNIGKGDISPVPDVSRGTTLLGRRWDVKFNPFSDSFQWLPCDVDISGDTAKIVSYINNLHPEHHRNLYGVIEKIIDAAIPLWDLTLAPLADEEYKPLPRIVYDTITTDPPWEFFHGKDANGPPKHEIREAELDEWDVQELWRKKNRHLVYPEPGKFNPSMLAVPRAYSLKRACSEDGRPLQVIVKLATIVLTPKKPHYKGGSWHVEGKMNEHIVATAIYYYSEENITSSSLAFRQLVEKSRAENMTYEQWEHDWLWEMYGCESEEPAIQEIGSVQTREGRLLTFPNVLQHQVQPFELEDPKKPGHRKILALFLVDPYVRIPSTSCVPPQQLDWFREELDKGAGTPIPTQLMDKLPVELKEHVYGEVEFPLTLEKAKQLRNKLMKERKSFVVQHDRAFKATRFSLCEH